MSHPQDFLFDGMAVGYFEETEMPNAAGCFRYMPYRGPGHYKMQTLLTAGLQVPGLVFVPVFLAVSLLAAWPTLTKRASHLFWLFAMWVWLVSSVASVMLLGLVVLSFSF